jgi:hypothetical protein
MIALNKMNLPASQVIVVENSPLGVQAAIKAGLECIITLNNTPLDIQNNFKEVMPLTEKIYLQGYKVNKQIPEKLVLRRDHSQNENTFGPIKGSSHYMRVPLPFQNELSFWCQ